MAVRSFEIHRTLSNLSDQAEPRANTTGMVDEQGERADAIGRVAGVGLYESHDPAMTVEAVPEVRSAPAAIGQRARSIA